MIAPPRSFIALAALAVVALTPGYAGARDKSCVGDHTLVLYNGRIHTMDATDTVVSSVTIRNGRVAAGGDSEGDCTQRVNLNGRVAVPGLIDNHNHFLLLGLRPGYHTPLENTASFADIAALYKARIAKAPKGVFITSIGGFVTAQWKEGRLPNLSELDAIAPNNPVYLQIAFTGPSTTNTLGKAFFAAHAPTLAVGADGSIADGTTALNALRSVQTAADEVRSTMDAMDYSAQLGVTDNFDMGGFINPGAPDHDSEFEFGGAASWDPYTAYDTILDLHRQGLMKVRVRVFFLSMDTDPTIPILSHRVENAFREFGDDWLRAAGLGEFITSWPLFGLPDPGNYNAAVKAAASRGWIYQQHSLSIHEDNLSLTAWEQLKPLYGLDIAPLHWSIAHVPEMTSGNLARLQALGAGVALHAWKYLYGSPPPCAPGPAGDLASECGAPAYRSILASGVHAGAGSDSAQISTLNPWNMLYYMTTGIDAHGDLVNAGQTITRAQALRLYTAENGWFSKEEDKMGSIETGKYGDVVVLSDDYFTVPDSALRNIRSVLTVVGGRITYDAGVLNTQGGDD